MLILLRDVSWKYCSLNIGQIPVLIFLLNLSVLVLVFVVYNRRREAQIKYPGPEDDVRKRGAAHPAVNITTFLSVFWKHSRDFDRLPWRVIILKALETESNFFLLSESRIRLNPKFLPTRIRIASIDLIPGPFYIIKEPPSKEKNDVKKYHF